MLLGMARTRPVIGASIIVVSAVVIAVLGIGVAAAKGENHPQGQRIGSSQQQGLDAGNDSESVVTSIESFILADLRVDSAFPMEEHEARAAALLAEQAAAAREAERIAAAVELERRAEEERVAAAIATANTERARAAESAAEPPRSEAERQAAAAANAASAQRSSALTQAPPVATPAAASDLQAAAAAAGWPSELLAKVERVAMCESSGSTTALSPAGYVGLMQVAPWLHGPVPADAVGQFAQAYRVYQLQGWGAWPVCGR
jgi:hypothetical protein